MKSFHMEGGENTIAIIGDFPNPRLEKTNRIRNQGLLYCKRNSQYPQTVRENPIPDTEIHTQDPEVK